MTTAAAPLDPHEVLAEIAALPQWFLDDLAEGGGVVEEMVIGDSLRSPSVQVDLLPGGDVQVLATHDQVLGGRNGQVYLGCRFPADPAYAVDLVEHGAAVGRELAAKGCAGRAGSTSWRPGGAALRPEACEVNLRKGGTTHPFSALRSLVPGHYDAGAGAWLADADGSTRAYRSTDNVVDPSLARAQAAVGHRRRARGRPAVRPGSRHRGRAAHARVPRRGRPFRGHGDRAHPGAGRRAVRGHAARLWCPAATPRSTSPVESRLRAPRPSGARPPRGSPVTSRS